MRVIYILYNNLKEGFENDERRTKYTFVFIKDCYQSQTIQDYFRAKIMINTSLVLR